MNSRILVVEDETTLCRNIARHLERSGHTVTAVESGRAAIEALSAQPFDIVLTDMRLPDADGLDLVERAKKASPDAVMMVMTAFGSLDAAISALRAGVHDFILKPISLADLGAKVARISAHARLVRETLYLRSLVHAEGDTLSLLRCGGDQMNRLCDVVEKLATSLCNVLIVGEIGTGKELVARALHERSRLSSGPFIPLNVAAVPSHSIESYLFGHRGGSVPGLDHDRDGLFRAASGGTIYLDEVGELESGVQAKLVRVVESKEVMPVGADVGVSVDVRVVAATRHDLEQRVTEGTFRRELLYRLRIVEIRVPPLRERMADLPKLVEVLLARHTRLLGKQVHEVDRAALEVLRRYEWPGNVRELSNVIERAVILAADGRITRADLPRELTGTDPSRADDEVGDLDEATLKFQRNHIERVLRSVGGSRDAAARALGLSSATFYRYLQKIGLKGFRLEDPAGG